MSQVYRNVIQAAAVAMTHDERTPRLLESLRKLDGYLIGKEPIQVQREQPATLRVSRGGRILALDERAHSLLGMKVDDEIYDLPDLSHGAPAPICLAGDEGQLIDLVAVAMNDRSEIALYEVGPPGRERTLSMLMGSFGLIPSERDVLRGLLAGDGAEQIAQDYGRSVGTVRQQIKSVLAKLNARSQGQAISRAAAIEATVDKVELAQIEASVPGVTRERMTLADVNVSVHRYGRRGGTPVLLLHGALFGAAATVQARRAADVMNLDIAMPERPGYGATAWTGPEQTAERVCDHLDALMNQLGWQKAVVLSHDIGTYFGFKFATSFPDRVAGLVCAPTTPPMTTWSQTADMPRKHRVNAWAAQQMPGLMDRIVRFGVSHIQRKGIGVTPDLVFSDSAFDRDAFADRQQADVLADSFRMMAAQDAVGFRNDMRLTNFDWRDLLQRVNVPATLFHGDRSGTVSAAAVAEMARTLPHGQHVRLKDAGHTLPLTDPDMVFREVFRVAVQTGL
ncbi:alpha/beta fold hydrolase [Pontivivens insulae]|uniref:Haloalkane dehalogenase n=1 Tax=Pontivivens insulae TaxID=1639689 RepID=A0A2R8AEK5_9RHOB|nr:alpha/beta fold hydrolase [Pontivivens insulae]RED11859.1 pimeloyl-ACP methyl ester carboxylesterase [Pontivivens insulae]SPF30616.1 Haloalkane dehalogenase [Pontivivens insulae]